MGGPGVDAVAAFLPHPRHIGLIENLESETETDIHFLLPLQQHRRWTGDYDLPHLFPQQQLAGDEARFDGFAQADIVGDEQIDALQQQGFAQRFQLVGVQADASAEWRLKQVGIGGGQAVPAQRVQIGGEQGPRIEAARRDGLPPFGGEQLGVYFPFP